MKFKKHIIFLAISALLFISSNAAFSQYLNCSRIIIKFKNQSKLYYELQYKDVPQEILQIEGFKDIKPFLSKPLLSSYQKKYFSRFRKISEGGRVQNLRRIFIVEFDSPELAEAFLQKSNLKHEFEYIEAFPERQICFVPNDTLLYKQYYHEQIRTFQAWDTLQTSDTALIAIVDTGVDIEHEDLSPNIWSNPGESGLDSSGADKRTNGIDDDANGYIDDWRGWDFGADNGEDNDPNPGNGHGTHVAGIAAAVLNNVAGGAGVAKNVKILPVKASGDNAFSLSVSKGYEGIMYAASMGADVINCSWGGTSFSMAEQEVINAALELGSVIVAAAGNNSSDQAFYPASYDGILDVASVTNTDHISFFSNYHSTVDILSPGSFIISTMPGNESSPNGAYDQNSGTSMASPVVAGVAAMVRLMFPDMQNWEVIERIIATATPIDTLLDQTLYGKTGKGRVDALNALTAQSPRSLRLISHSIKDSNNDSIFDAGEILTISLDLKNMLSPLSNSFIRFRDLKGDVEILGQPDVLIGSFQNGETKHFQDIVKVKVNPNVRMDREVTLLLEIFADDSYHEYKAIQFTVRPSYRTMDFNNLKITFNSRGNLGYNDYPENEQGKGIRYKDSENLAYEGSLMIAAADTVISDVARSRSQSFQNRDFFSEAPFKISGASDNMYLGEANFKDFRNTTDSGVVVVSVNQKVYQFTDQDKEDFILLEYSLVNKSEFRRDSLFAGLYFDWDIGPNGADNVCEYYYPMQFGYAKHNQTDTLPLAGASVLSSHKTNFWALDNNGKSEDNPGVYDGFKDNEKWKTMTNGIGRANSNQTDISMVISAGPIKLEPDDTAKVVFAVFGADNFEDLKRAAANASLTALREEISVKNFNAAGGIDALYPNPANDFINIRYVIAKESEISIEIFDSNGKKVQSLVNRQNVYPGVFLLEKNIAALSSGGYFLRLIVNKDKFTVPFIIAR